MRTISLFALLLSACTPPAPVPCNCDEAKCPPCVAADASTPVVRPDAAAPAPVVCTGCTCATLEATSHHHRRLTTPEQPEHSAVCPGADSHNPDRKHCSARVHTHTDASGKHRVRHYTAPAGLSPADLANAYKLPAKGSTGTIAIIDAFGYKNAESDLATYRKQYSLPACTVASGCLRIVNQNGKASPLPPDPTADDDWTVETALDLDMASAACPSCKLLLIQADSDSGDGLYVANDTAAALGATVVSNSWGGDDVIGLVSETHFAHPGIGYFASAGDDGAGASYPATSGYVTAVGGTTLIKNSSVRGWTETAWNDSGSGCSAVIAKPAWQTNTNTNCSKRAEADVSAVADPATGAAIYNNGPSNNGWTIVGGTSLSSPFVAGVMLLTGHAAAGPSFAWANHGAFFDVTYGNNGSCGAPLCTAGNGWDGPTGWGTPNGAVLAGAPPTCPSSCCTK